MSANPNPRDEYPKPPFSQKEQDWPGYESKMSPQADWGQTSYKGSEKLKGQTALITGGDSGIGRAVAIAFSREGADVAIAYLPQEQQDAEECQSLVQSCGRKCHLIPGDLSDPAYCASLVDNARRLLGGTINHLVLNAASQGKAVKSIDELTWDRVLQSFKVNIVSMFEVTRLAIPHMPKGGSIITTGSIQAYDPSQPILDYATTKAAIVAFTKGLSSELVPKGIRVNCVAPGPVWTPLVAASFPNEKLKNFGKQCPMERPGQPAELAPAYVFLASNDASFISGEVLGVTGGGILA